MLRIITIPLSEILDVVCCAEMYGFQDDVLMSALAYWAESVSDEEIHQFALDYSQKDGYTEEDYDAIVEKLHWWKEKYKPLCSDVS
jgi:hypothetical protein